MDIRCQELRTGLAVDLPWISATEKRKDLLESFFSHHLECKSVQELFLLLMLHALATFKSHAKWIYNMWSAKNRLQREIEHRSKKMRGGRRRLKDITSIEEKTRTCKTCDDNFSDHHPACMHPWISLPIELDSSSGLKLGQGWWRVGEPLISMQWKHLHRSSSFMLTICSPGWLLVSHHEE